MHFGLLIWAYLVTAVVAVIAFSIGRGTRRNQLPPLSYRRNLPHGSYICLGTVQITGRLYVNHAIETVYLTVLKSSKGKLGIYLFEERSLSHFIIDRNGITEDDLRRN